MQSTLAALQPELHTVLFCVSHMYVGFWVHYFLGMLGFGYITFWDSVCRFCPSAKELD